MGQSDFNIEEIRRNWARAIEPPKGGLPPRLANVEPPRDVPADVRVLVERIRDLTRKHFPERETTLAPFFEEALRLAERLGAAPAGGDASKETPVEQMMNLLYELEDLLDAFTTVQR